MPLLRNHDRSLFDIYLYASVARPDPVTEEYRAWADDHFRDISRMDDVSAGRPGAARPDRHPGGSRGARRRPLFAPVRLQAGSDQVSLTSARLRRDDRSRQHRLPPHRSIPRSPRHRSRRVRRDFLASARELLVLRRARTRPPCTPAAVGRNRLRHFWLPGKPAEGAPGRGVVVGARPRRGPRIPAVAGRRGARARGDAARVRVGGRRGRSDRVHRARPPPRVPRALPPDRCRSRHLPLRRGHDQPRRHLDGRPGRHLEWRDRAASCRRLDRHEHGPARAGRGLTGRSTSPLRAGWPATPNGCSGCVPSFGPNSKPRPSEMPLGSRATSRPPIAQCGCIRANRRADPKSRVSVTAGVKNWAPNAHVYGERRRSRAVVAAPMRHVFACRISIDR